MLALLLLLNSSSFFWLLLLVVMYFYVLSRCVSVVYFNSNDSKTQTCGMFNFHWGDNFWNVMSVYISMCINECFVSIFQKYIKMFLKFFMLETTWNMVKPDLLLEIQFFIHKSSTKHCDGFKYIVSSQKFTLSF